MADFDVRVGDGSGAAPAEHRRGRHYVQEAVVDFSEIDTGLEVNETVALFDVPAGTLVKTLTTDVREAAAVAGVIDIGEEGGDVDGYDAAVAVNSVARVAGNGALVVPEGTVYDADTVIMLTQTAAVVVADGKTHFYLECIALERIDEPAVVIPGR